MGLAGFQRCVCVCVLCLFVNVCVCGIPSVCALASGQCDQLARLSVVRHLGLLVGQVCDCVNDAIVILRRQ